MATKKCPYCAEQIQEDAIKCRHCDTWLAVPPGEKVSGPPLDEVSVRDAADSTRPRRLTRSTTDRMLAGVCGGMGKYLKIDPTIIRIVWVLVTFLGVGSPILLYIIMAFMVPLDDQIPA